MPNVKTIELPGSETEVRFGENYPYFWVRNFGSGDVLMSLSPNVVPDADGVILIPAGEGRSTGDVGQANTLWLLGNGKVEVIPQHNAVCPFFKHGGKGGDGGGSVDLTGYARKEDIPDVSDFVSNPDDLNIMVIKNSKGSTISSSTFTFSDSVSINTNFPLLNKLPNGEERTVIAGEIPAATQSKAGVMTAADRVKMSKLLLPTTSIGSQPEDNTVPTEKATADYVTDRLNGLSANMQGQFSGKTVDECKQMISDYIFSQTRLPIIIRGSGDIASVWDNGSAEVKASASWQITVVGNINTTSGGYAKCLLSSYESEASHALSRDYFFTVKNGVFGSLETIYTNANPQPPSLNNTTLPVNLRSPGWYRIFEVTRYGDNSTFTLDIILNRGYSNTPPETYKMLFSCAYNLSKLTVLHALVSRQLFTKIRDVRDADANIRAIDVYYSGDVLNFVSAFITSAASTSQVNNTSDFIKAPDEYSSPNITVTEFPIIVE